MNPLYLFPFNKIEKGSKIVIYGAGYCGQMIYSQCKRLEYCEVILWIDRRWQQLNNEFNKYELSSIQELKKIDNKIDYIIIAIADNKIVKEVENLIIDMGINRNKFCYAVDVNESNIGENVYISKERYLDFQVGNILPSNYVSVVKKADKKQEFIKSKIKIRFAISSLNNIIGLQSIAKAYSKDSKYDVCIIVVGDPKGVRAELDELSIPYMYIYDYDIIRDKPDVFFVTYGGQVVYEKIRNYSKYIVAVHISIVKWSNISIKEYVDQVKKQFQYVTPDIYIWDKLLYEEMKSNNLLRDNYYLIGNPKFDVIYEGINNKDIEYVWPKLEGKKVFLWCTDHVYYCDNITFDLMAKYIIEVFSKDNEIGLIFRPHPSFIDEMLDNLIWSEEDIYYLKRYMELSPNMVWDDHGTYIDAYNICDAVMVDSECGIICSSLPIGVPIAALTRPEKDEYAQDDIVSNAYKIKSETELIEFIDMVKSGEDDLKENRRVLADKMINYFDGMNGERIKQLVEERLIKE